LKTTTHHPDSGEDKPAETDDRTGIYGERFERSHQRLRAREIHRALRMGDASKCERNKSRPHHSRGAKKFLLCDAVYRPNRR